MRSFPKLSFGMIVLNGEPFIKYNLENLYPYAHEILVVEGAVGKFGHAATVDGHSIDDTVEIIKSFPDPEKKIKLIQRDGFWPEKDEMSNAYMEVCTGDYIWQVDADEFYKGEDIEKMSRYLEDNPDVTRVVIRTINFWRGFRAVIQGATSIYGTDGFVRIFKFKPGYRYRTHRPPTVIDRDGSIPEGRTANAGEVSEGLGIYIYHYSYTFPDVVRFKSSYYSKMNFLESGQDAGAWYTYRWLGFSNPLRIHLTKYPPSWIIPFDKEHPDVIKRLISDIGFEEDGEVLAYLDGEYKKYKTIGERLCRIIVRVRKGRIDRLKDALLVLLSLIVPFSKKDIQVNRTIVGAAIRLWMW